MAVEPTMGVVYLDREVKYDVTEQTPEGPVVRPLVVLGDKVPTASDMFFFALDSSIFPTIHEEEDTEDEGPERTLEDPCMMEATEDVNRFLASTFWSAHRGLRACRSALALSKRGMNVLQCFLLLGAGGCGLSLFTELIAASLGEEAFAPSRSSSHPS